MRNRTARTARWTAYLASVFVFTMLLFYGARAQGQAAAPVPVGEAVADRPHYQPCVDRDGPGPAPCVADPLTQPREVVDAVATARRFGWGLLVMAIAFPLLVIARRWVPWLRTGWRALVSATVLAMLAGAVNAGFLGGAWEAMLVAAFGAAPLAVQGKGPTEVV